ncbi:ornithine cyclodeaminase family protein [Marimonas lutisalis]|uniref:ornithine cyclodeaminase family protein n=1 Tax=Marimonas lutisalis TaxID=2545756 RepID=UPI0010F8A315|nr:ornithine cyclodeaminase family protein [Marimonas lutisalis]
MTLPHLTAAGLDALGLSAATLCDAIEETIREADAGRAASAPKAMLDRPDGRYMMTTMAADDRFMVVKSMVQNPANPAAGLPYIDGLVSVLDARTGQPVALIDGPWLTARRTAALSATAARYLAPPRARVLAMLGAGVQAHSHLQALAELFPLQELRILGRGQPGIDRLAAAARGLGLAPRIATSAQEAIEGADIVVSALSRDAAPSGAIRADWLGPRSFAALPDLGHHWARDSLSRLSPLLVDDLAQEASLPPGKRLSDPAQVAGDLADLVMGRLTPRSGTGPAGFVFRGHALGDLAAARAILSGAGL